MAPKSDAGLLVLQGQIKRDPESYEEEFQLQLRHYKACLEIFSLKPSEESQDFASLVTFTSQVSHCYPELTRDFVRELSDLLDKHYAIMSSALRHTLVKALILMRNRNQVPAMDLLPLFFRLFRCQDKSLRQLLYRHIVTDIKAANQRHQDGRFNRAVQSFLYAALGDAHEAAAKKSLAVLIELWRRQVWRDARTVNVIATAVVHSSSQLMLAALKFFLGQDELDPEDSDAEDAAERAAQPSSADVFRATKKGTAASKKKKGAKLKRVLAAVKKQQRRSGRPHENFAAVQLLHDPQRFAEELFGRLRKSAGERFEVRMAMLGVVSRVVGVHKLLLLNFYPFMQKFVLPHQREAPALLATLVQAVHDEVPPDALTPVLRQLVDQFVHDRARPEVMTLGLKTVREMCERAPLVMTPELLQDLALYKKFREREVASAARSLVALFRELAPGMLEKRDRGRDADLDAAPAAFGARRAASRVEGAELLQAALQAPDASDGEASSSAEEVASADEESGSEAGDCDGSESDSESDSEAATPDSEEIAGPERSEKSESLTAEEVEAGGQSSSCSEGGESGSDLAEEADNGGSSSPEGSTGEAPLDPPAEDTAKRKRDSTRGSLSSLKKQVAEAREARRREAEGGDDPGDGALEDTPLEYGRILSEDDFARIRELRHQKMVEQLMRKHGLKSAAKKERLLAAAQDEADEALDRLDSRATLGEDRLDPDALLGRHRARANKRDRLDSVIGGREGREFGAATARKRSKAGGQSNAEKVRRKALPAGARKAVAQRRAGKQRVGGKNFKGRAGRR